MSLTPALSRAPRRPRLRDRLLLSALVLAVLGGLAGLAAGTGWAEIGAQIGAVRPWQLCTLLGLSLANYLARALRWHRLARRLGLPTDLAQDTRHYLGGFAMARPSPPMTSSFGIASCC